MRLTPRGIGVLVAAVICGVGSYAFGVADLWMMAAAGVLLVLFAAVYVVVRRLEFRVDRLVTPPRVPAGNSARIQVGVVNRGRRTTPVVGLSDPWDDGARVAEFELAPLAPGEEVRATYRIPTEDRGLFTLGPLVVTQTDPLGLCRRRVPIGAATALTVFPATVPLRAPDHLHGTDPRGGTLSESAVGTHGDHFHSLRPYVVGDDLRRVHWKSSARTDDLQVRQDEAPWRGRCTVAVDTRARVHNRASFELAMSVAASVLRAAVSAELDVRLLTATGTDLGGTGATSQLDQLFEHLAVVAPDEGTAPLLLRRVGRAPLVLITTARGAADETLAQAVRAARVTATVLAVGPDSIEAAPTLADFPVVRVPSLDRLTRIWNGHVGEIRVSS